MWGWLANAGKWGGGERGFGVVCRYKAIWNREFKLPWRKAGVLISMIKWIRTSRLSIDLSLSLSFSLCVAGTRAGWQLDPQWRVQDLAWRRLLVLACLWVDSQDPRAN